MTEDVKDVNLVDDSTETPIEDNSQDTHEVTDDTTKIDNKRAMQIAEGSKREVDRVRALAVDAEVKLAAQDANNLLELAKKDPKLANEVAKRFGYDSFLTAQKNIKSGEQVEKQPEEDREVWYQNKRAQEEHDKSLLKAEKIIAKLPDDIQEKAQAFFDKASKGQLLDEDTALEFAEAATLYANKGKSVQSREDGLAAIASIGGTRSDKPVKKTEEFQKLKIDKTTGKLVLRSDK